MLTVSGHYHVLDGGGVWVYTPLVEATHTFAILTKVPQLKEEGSGVSKWGRGTQWWTTIEGGGTSLNKHYYIRMLNNVIQC